MPFRINSSEEFERLLEGIADDLVHAKIHFRLHQDLSKSIKEYEREFNESRTFWFLTFRAQYDACVFRLCRAYDQNDSALHLNNWLKIISRNIKLFEVDEFRTRLKDNTFVESLAVNVKKPNIEQLKKDIKATSNKNSLVKKLTILRNNIFAHRNAKLTMDNRNILEERPIKTGEIEKLLDQGIEILNRYSKLFKALSYSTQIVGHDDYKYVLEAIKKDIKRFETRS
ncbi:hypothetical protein [Gracilimonas mengyeensis]|uniref:HEPN AbiU2-like domain-containing protein n=1 Tax=Gracilimonas mengyeensis TaxID=1302730 RepID=A0A521BEP3_9BACT|nr:hypothetical protein [Gracilimonas mengyeensis]SMO45543.1 hypothetical protein SAMN06265219_102226 [Gracilimonas mengyeensis]